jgi:hypothetical protein
MHDHDQTIRSLEAENVRLRTVLSRAGIYLLPPPDMPNDAELSKLLKMVEQAYPRLRCPEGGPGFAEANLDQFRNTIRWACYAYRVAEPATEYATVFWMDAVRSFHAEQGYSIDRVAVRPFTAGIIASGIVFGALDEFPFGVNIGVSLGTAADPSDAWRDVLRNGVKRPVELRSRPMQQPTRLDMVRPHIR